MFEGNMTNESVKEVLDKFLEKEDGIIFINSINGLGKSTIKDKLILAVLEKNRLDAFKAGHKKKDQALRLLISEIHTAQKSGKDVDIQSIIKTEIKKRKESGDLYKSLNQMEKADQEFLEKALYESYLPKEVSEKEIQDFISTLDFSGFKSRMQAMKPIMEYFKGKNINGSTVKEILERG